MSVVAAVAESTLESHFAGASSYSHERAVVVVVVVEPRAMSTCLVALLASSLVLG